MNRFKQFILDNPEYDNNSPLDENEWENQLAQSNPLEKYLRNKKREEQNQAREE
jgi:hypothetical protein